MKYFQSKQELQGKIDALTSQLEESEAENASLMERIESLESESVTKDETIATMTSNLAASKEAEEELSAELKSMEEAKEKAESETKEAEASTSAKAVEIAAAAGHESVEPESSDEEDNSPEGLYAQYRVLQSTNPRAAQAFWKEHEDVIKQK